MGKQEQINILTQNFQKRQRVAPIHVPILIPINNKKTQPFSKTINKHTDNRGTKDNQNKQNMSNDRSIFMNEYFGDEKIL